MGAFVQAWPEASVTDLMIRRAAVHVRWFAKFDEDTCRSIAHDAFTRAWEEHRLGHRRFANKQHLSDFIVAYAQKIAHKESVRSRSHLSYQENNDGGVYYGKQLYPRMTPARQIEIRYATEIVEAVALLPAKQRRVIELLTEGLNVVDIALRLGIPVHTCLKRIREGRLFMFAHGLIETAIQGTGVPS